MGALIQPVDFRSTADPRTSARKATDRAMSEKTFQAKVMGRARETGWRLFIHYFPGSFSNGRWLTNVNREGLGYPDLYLLRPPLSLALELKREAHQPRPEQAVWLEAFAGLPGCVAMAARPRDWELVADLLARPWAYLPESERWIYERTVDDGASVE